MKKITQSRAFAVLIIEMLLTISICGGILFANFILLENQSSQYTNQLASDYYNLTERYIAAFRVLVMHVRAKVNVNPSFEEMLRWLQSQDEVFAEAIDPEVFDGFYMTYKGGYARSWTYGDYSKYNPASRKWYQQAEKAGGKVTVVAPYLSFLGTSQLKEDEVVILSIAQRYSDEITFGIDLKLKQLNDLLARRDKKYQTTRELLLDKEGDILSASDKKLYAHNIYHPDEVLSEDMSRKLQAVQAQPESLRVNNLDNRLFFTYASQDREGNTYVMLSEFAPIFWERFLWPLVLMVVLLALEAGVYLHNKKALLELSERDTRLLLALAYYFDGVYVESETTRKVESLKADSYFQNIAPDTDFTHNQLIKLVAERFVAPDKAGEFLEEASLERIQARLRQSPGFSLEVPMVDGHWCRLHFIRSSEYAGNHQFIFVIENADNDMRRLQELGDALHAANKANLAKSEFLSRMSHEIRTPMNAVVGLTAIARHYTDEPERISDYLEKIDSSSKVLLGIINDILDMSAIASRKMKLAEAEFDLQEVLNAIQTLYAVQCEQKGVEFVLVSPPGRQYLLGDSLRLRQILLNLVSNAFKFTPAGGRISVTVTERQRQGDKVYLRFEVSDTGVGMGPEMLARLFKPFEQESAAVARKYGGSGLGLSITKNLVELMQGHIEVESEKGRGTTFAVDLPFTVASGPEGLKSTNARPKSVGKYDFKGRKLLVAEDNAINQMVVREILIMAHLQPVFAVNGQQAVELFQASAPGTFGLILMDIQMPVMNGYEATKAIRALDRADAATIPIYAMTANAFTEDVSAALASGMNGHLAKPIDVKELYGAIAKVLR
jgi:signal transduction histidine kinase